MICQVCGVDVGKRERVGRRDTCPACGSDLHSCVHCIFYEVGAYNDCREPNAERVVEKKRSNFCEYFSPHAGAARATRATSGSAKNELEKLFGGAKGKT